MESDQNQSDHYSNENSVTPSSSDTAISTNYCKFDSVIPMYLHISQKQL